ncbi:hypothetical protein ACHOLT_06850 [Desulfitobacterium sp. Sab5]|uniref:hypothetical protein n=1 Tax=Desulfitobacterium nosdiversum TaxID=3375356 RepID=UPI003CF401E8
MGKFYCTIKKHINIILSGLIIFCVLSVSALITLKYIDHTEADNIIMNDKDLKNITADDIIMNDKDLKNITAEDLKETELTVADTLNNSDYPLIARLPERDIYLYGLNKSKFSFTGVILKQGSHIQTFKWNYLTARLILPKIKVADYDHDGTDEVLIILDTASGTGVAIEELHILEPRNDGLYDDIEFLPDDYINQLNSNIQYNYNKEENKFIFNIGNNKYEMDTANKFKNWTFKNITYGTIIYFDTDNIIQITAAPGYLFKEIVSPQFFSAIKAKVNYNNGEFKLSDFEFKENPLPPLR